MRHFLTLQGLSLEDTWLTVGTFDGVHLGHQEIVRQLAAEAHRLGYPAVVLTFFPHPAVVLGKRSDPFYITTPEERADLLGKFGADIVITLPFDRQMAETSAHDFISRLETHLGMRHLVIGQDFALGKNREGNAGRLAELGNEFGYSLEVFPPIEMDGEIVSSSRIRAALSGGDIDLVTRLLGRPFAVTGQVVPGDGRGHTIGIPTANLNLWAERAIPKAGVYVSQATINGQTWGAVTNVGVRPTFETELVPPRVETHLLDFDSDLYGQDLRLSFLRRLRDEQRFPDIQALVNQIHADIRTAREWLAAYGSQTEY
jgi:riboflavin kinase / FMN adenylyltransferase